MKKISFKRITAQNFLSIGKEVAIDFLEGITIITGVNKDKAGDQNGVGKSSILSALVFSLYGKTCNDLKKEEIVNNIAGKGCLTTLDFEVDENGTVTTYRIVRGIGPQKAQLYVNGDDKDNPATLPAFNQKIEQILGTSVELFKQTVIMSLDTDIRFMKLSKPERRTFVENIFNLEIIKKMNQIAKDKHSTISKDHSVLLSNKNIFQSVYENHQSSMKCYMDSCKAKVAPLKTSLDAKEASLNSEDMQLIPNEPSKEVLEGKLASIQTVKNDIQRFKKDISDLETKLLDDSSVSKSNTMVLNSKLSEWKNFKAKFDAITNVKEFEYTSEEASDKIESNRQTISNLSSSIRNSENLINKIKSLGSVCTQCERPFDESDKKKTSEQIEAETKNIRDSRQTIEDLKKDSEDLKAFMDRKTLKDAMDKIAEEGKVLRGVIKSKDDLCESTRKLISLSKVDIDENIAKVESIQREYDELYTIPRKNQQIRSFRSQLEKDIETIKKDLSEAENPKNVFEDLINKAKKDIEDVDSKIESSSKNLDVYNVVKVVLSDEGFKSKIVNEMIGVLNERIGFYLTKLNAPCTINFNSVFEDTILNERCVEVSYFSFSGGERRRIDLACLFAFMDMRRYQGDVVYNLSFFDEILDSALSVNGSQLLFTLLKDRFLEYGESAYIVTHKLENGKNPIVDHKIYLEKIGGITKIERME